MEPHAANGYLFDQFLKLQRQRTDGHGRSVQNTHAIPPGSDRCSQR
ncbi:hypothetical protein HTS88_21570 [Pseudarthrobacter oxydans]|nr:hypothetical protein [Pseudarthrobacter oxydans]